MTISRPRIRINRGAYHSRTEEQKREAFRDTVKLATVLAFSLLEENERRSRGIIGKRKLHVSIGTNNIPRLTYLVTVGPRFHRIESNASRGGTAARLERDPCTTRVPETLKTSRETRKREERISRSNRNLIYD